MYAKVYVHIHLLKNTKKKHDSFKKYISKIHFGANSGHYQDSRRCIHAFDTKKKNKNFSMCITNKN